MSDGNKNAAQRWIKGIWDDGEFPLLEELATTDYVYRAVGQDELRGEAFRDFVTMVRSAFPDLNNTIESQVAEGDIVVTRGTSRGTHQGPFNEIAPTEKTVVVPWVIITRFSGGRIAEDWEIYDALGLMTQLGAAAPAA